MSLSSYRNAAIGLLQILCISLLSASNAFSQTVPAGSLIIPMDNIRYTVAGNANTGGQQNVIKAYGLVYDLLSVGVNLKWSFSTTKNHGDNTFTNGVDFTAPSNSVKVRKGNTTISTSIPYRGSQFIVDVADTAIAGPRVRAFGSTNSVTVHQVLSALSAVPVQFLLNQIPRAYIEDRTPGNLALMTDVFASAGIPSSAYTTSSTGVPAITSLSGTGNSCYTSVMIPHEDAMTSTDVANMKNFATDGGNVVLQCHAIEDFETAFLGNVLTTTGIDNQNDATYTHPDAGAQMAIGQFVGTAEDQSGSVRAWKLPNGGAYQTGVVRVVQKSTDATYCKVMAVRKDNDPAQGMFVYLGGHEYTGKTNLSRTLLNAFFLPAQRGLCTPLPVELVAFSATLATDAVDLRWKTLTEKNNYGFDIQRRLGGADWTTIAFVGGHGTVSTPQLYSFRDTKAPATATSLSYRLKQIDRDGSASYSATVELRATSEMPVVSILGISPNPTAGYAALSFSLANETLLSISIYDVVGHEAVKVTVEEPFSAGSHVRTLDLSALVPGPYYVIMKNLAGTTTSRLIIER